MRSVVFVLSMFAYGDAMAAGPPVPFIDNGACPFECCGYRDWTTEKTTALRASPDSKAKIIGAAFSGDAVLGLTGEVVTSRPGSFRVTAEHVGADGTRYRPGDRVYVYTYLGEGVMRVWYAGSMHEEEVYFMHANPDDSPMCTDRKMCWGRQEAWPESDWWVKVRTGDGVTGWSDQPHNFGNIDACG
jgi:hypothetical protein